MTSTTTSHLTVAFGLFLFGFLPFAIVPTSALGAEIGESRTLLSDGSTLILGGAAPGTPTTRASLSGARGPDRFLPSQLQFARAWHTATVLPNGKVLVFGGVGPDGHAVKTMEVFDPSSQRFEALPESQLIPRSHHTATLLTDGTVLIAGGVTDAGVFLNDIQIWDYQTGEVHSYASALQTPRENHRAQLLDDGSVLFSGGTDMLGAQIAPDEIYLPDLRADMFGSAPPAVAPMLLMRSQPQQGESQHPIHSPLWSIFSRNADVTTVSPESFVLKRADGSPVSAQVTPAENGKLAFLLPDASLEPATSYILTIQGVVDTDHNPVPTTVIHFTTAGDSQESDQEWVPNSENLRGNWHSGTGLSSWQKLPPLAAGRGVTAVAGQTLRLNGKPLANVTLSVGRIKGKTDSTGRFLLAGVPAGQQILLIDGRSANRARVEYGVYEASLLIQPRQTNALNYTIWMSALDTADAATISSPAVRETVITTPRIPGLELHLPPNTVITDYEGRAVTRISITAIPVDKPPFPLPAGVQVPTYFTIQPGGASISIRDYRGAKTGAWLVYPNPYKDPTGTVFDFWNYDADKQGWYVYGQGKVDSTGNHVVPDPGVYIYEFTGAMVGSTSTAPATGPNAGNNTSAGQAGDPVDLSTGLFVYSKTDLALPDTIPLNLSRYYRPNDSRARNFGIGTTDSLNLYMVGVTRPYLFQELVMPDGSRIRFNRTSPGTSYDDAVYEHTATNTRWYGAVLQWNHNITQLPGVAWVIRTRDGTMYCFPDSDSLVSQGKQGIIFMLDRNGNTVTFTRDSAANLTQVTSPNGRYIRFTYDAQNRVTAAADNVGRTVQYAYDAQGNLSTVTDAAGGITTYTYDDQHNMLTIKDPRNIVFLTNQYDSAGRVVKQTQADGSIYAFAWTPSTNSSQQWITTSSNPSLGFVNRYSSTDSQGYTGLIASVDITDPRGYIRRVTFNSYGFIATDTRALNQPEQQTTTYQYFADNLQSYAADPLGRTTSFDYDTNGNPTRITLLSGTGAATTSTATYTSDFNRIATATDPLNHTTTYSYDARGNLVTVTDPLGNQTMLTYDGAGNVVGMTDPLGQKTTLGYFSGDLTSEADPLGNVTAQFHDYAGRTVSNTDPLGNRTTFQFDPLNQMISSTDARNGVTQFAYDANGNLLTVTDALNHSTNYTYDSMDRMLSVADALERTSGRTSDANGNTVSSTDRKGQVTLLGYDALNRLKTIGYNARTLGSNTSYESVLTFTWDAGNRLASIDDSTSGTITRVWDNLDRLTQETTPQGAVVYGYDPAGRRASMQATGQSVVSYTWDNADRLSRIQQGLKSVQFSYDAARRRTALTLPNGIVAAYGYDAASRLTSITYTLGIQMVGNLLYGYDAAGRRVSVGGTLANTLLPGAVTDAAYDAANQLTRWKGNTITYDANGNMLSDGLNAYSWNARGALTGISGAASASFVYDGLGRRVSKSVAGTQTAFLYDGIDAVQEQLTGTARANLLVGGVDEFFSRTDAVSDVAPIVDALGSVLALADSAGNLVTRYQYDPFGNTSVSGGASNNNREFNGRENDAEGMYYYRTRYYSSGQQRFISRDPLGFAGGDSNLYRYTGDNPTGYNDPAGMSRKTDDHDVCNGTGWPWTEIPASWCVDTSMPDRFISDTEIRRLASSMPYGLLQGTKSDPREILKLYADMAGVLTGWVPIEIAPALVAYASTGINIFGLSLDVYKQVRKREFKAIPLILDVLGFWDKGPLGSAVGLGQLTSGFVGLGR